VNRLLLLTWPVTGVEEAQQGDLLKLSTISNAAHTLARAWELGLQSSLPDLMGGAKR